MSKIIEVLDALPGCGKTYAVFNYMAARQEDKWIYVSPMKKEINERVTEECERAAIRFFIATERNEHEENNTKVQQALEALKQGENIACTHNLLLRFTQEHIDLLELQGYNIVCDEEIEMISAYNELKKGDVAYLLEKGSISIDAVTGKVSVIDQMLAGTKYDRMKRHADMECLYAALQRNEFLVTQISPKVIHASKRFILLTYNYNGSIMDTFMKMNGFDSKPVQGIQLYKSSEQVIKQLKDLITVIETPSVKKWHLNNPNTLTATWWSKSPSDEDLTALSKACHSIMNYSKIVSEDTMITLPKANTGLDSNLKGKKFKVKSLDLCSSYVQSKARATNEFAHKELCLHLYNLYPNMSVSIYMLERGFACNPEVYALNTIVQWVFRSRVRKGEPIKVAFFSKRMHNIFKQWLMSV